jgi:hypothetical protein
MAVESNRMLGGVGAALIVISAVSPILVVPRLFDAYSTSAALASPFSTVLGLAGLARAVYRCDAYKTQEFDAQWTRLRFS